MSYDRGPHPKNPGDRAYGHGDEITFEFASIGTESEADLNADGELPQGYFVDFDGTGGVVRPDQVNSSNAVPYGDGDESTTDGTEADFDAVLKHSAEVGDDVTVILRGAVRAAESGHGEEVLDDVDGDDLIALR